MSQPIFHEGSKGYSCCKHRTLDFDEFCATTSPYHYLLNSFTYDQVSSIVSIKGCRTGRHLFVGPKKEDKEEPVICRCDHYQTPRQVIVSVFGKGADKEASKVVFESETVRCLFLSDSQAVSDFADTDARRSPPSRPETIHQNLDTVRADRSCCVVI